MSRKTIKYAALCASLLIATVFAGCGTENKEGASLSTVAKVDEAACAQCHGSAREKLTGRVIYDDYALSVHALKAVGCQDCHGGGAQHNGVGPIPFPKPGHEQCKSCHDADQLVTNYASSQHFNAATEDGEELCNRCHTHQGAVLAAQFGYTGDKSVMDAKVNAPGAITGAESIKCNTCHLTHKPQELRVDAGWAPSTTVGAATNNGNAQYKLCTQCHTYINPAGQLVASGNNGTASFYHNTAWNRVIAATHYDNPATGVGLSSTKIEGYVMRTNMANPCFDCHGHESKTNTNILSRDANRNYVRITPEPTIYTDWAQSAHAGGLLAQKYAAVDAYPKKANGTYDRSAGMLDAVMAAGVDGNSGPAWEHYNWDASSRISCARCHTATGAATFLDSVAAYNKRPASDTSRFQGNTTWYNASNLTFNHLKDWTLATGSPQNEVLYCWGCHTNAGTGAIRNPGRMPAEYAFNNTSTAKSTFPNVSSSNLCLACHGGRAGGTDIMAVTDAAISAPKSFTNSHYLGAGASLFKAIGYEYTGREYANSSSFQHDKLGSAAVPNTGTSGPCVACHMGNGSKPANHKFKLAGFGGGTCGTAGACHTSLTQAELDEEKEHYETALFALSTLLKDKGFTWVPSSPYFAATNNYTVWTTGTVTAEQGRKTLGAAFNLNYLLHEPGGYAHNRYYIKRLLIDSIDFMNNGVLEPLTTVTYNNRTYYDGSDAAAAIQSAVGKTYADHDGVVQTFTQAQADIATAYLDGTTSLAGFQRR
jgi:hypothetical protein